MILIAVTICGLSSTRHLEVNSGFLFANRNAKVKVFEMHSEIKDGTGPGSTRGSKKNLAVRF